MIKIFLESDKFSYKAGVTKHATNSLACKSLVISVPIKDFYTFLSKITKYNRVPLGFDPSVARLLGHDPTPGYKMDHRAVLAFTDQCTSGGTGPYRSALVRIY